MPVTKKATKRKPTQVPKGVHLKKSTKGFSVHVHAANGNKLAVLTGYNTKQNALKGLRALHIAIDDALDLTGKYAFTDHTTAKKVTPRKK